MAWTAGTILTAAELNTYLPQTITAWASPIAGGITLGNGTVTANYTQVGKLVHAEFIFSFGSTSAITGDVSLDLPIDSASSRGAQGSAWFDDTGTRYFGQVFSLGTTAVIVRTINVGATYPTHALLSATVPFTWATGDIMIVSFSYLSV